MASKSLMEKPICLICNTNAELQVNPVALEILKGITQPLVVVSIVGLYRTGKSYLMNKLANENKGFPLGATIEAKTKGIWMWCLPHPRKPNKTLVLLDTEGLADVAKGNTKNDDWIFSLAVLLSSTFVYNSIGAINAKAIAELHFVTELSKFIKVKAKGQTDEENDDPEDEADLVRCMPDFVWVLRDMTLQLKLEKRGSKEEKVLTDPEYLEYSLDLKKGVSADVMTYNTPRNCIKHYFPTRTCFVFVRPTSEDKINNMESLEEKDLEPKFTEKARLFCDYIHEKAEVKKVIGGHEVNGGMFSVLVQTYVDTILSGAIPCLENAVISLATIENQKAVKDALEHYKTQMEKLVPLPMELQEMSDLHIKCQKEALQVFSKRSFKDDGGKYQEQFMIELTKCYVEMQEKNKKCSLEKCQNLLKDLSATLEKNLKDGVYAKPGGYKMYTHDQNEIVKKYNMSPNKGVQAEEALNEFLTSKSGEGNAIMQADKNLDEAEKKVEEEKKRARLMEQKQKMLEEENLKADQKAKDLERTHKEILAQMEAKNSEDREKMKKEFEKAMESKMKLEIDMREKNFKDQADFLKQQIADLKKEASDARKKETGLGIVGSIMNGIGSIIEKGGRNRGHEGAYCYNNRYCPDEY